MDHDAPALINAPALQARACLLAGTMGLLGGGLLLYLDIRWISGITPPPILGFFGMMLAVLLLVGGLVCLPMAGVLWLQSGRVESDLAGYLRGNHLAHWVHAPADWLVIVQNRRIRRFRAALVWMLSILGFGTLLGIMLFFALSGAEALLGLAGGLLGGAVAGFLVAFWIRVWARHRVADMLRDGGHIYIGEESAYCGGEQLYWGTSSRSLQSVQLLEGAPRTLFLTVEFSTGIWGPLLQTALAAQGRYQRVPQSSKMLLNIPVPSGREAEAQAVAERLSRRVTG